MLWDTHVHTHFSTDSRAAPVAMIGAAMDAGLSGLCFTDHLDYDYPVVEQDWEPEYFLINFKEYFRELTGLSVKYKNTFPIHIGLELGLQPHLADRHAAILKQYPLDFVIGSSHIVHGSDPYYPEYYEGRSEDKAYEEYFTSILENIAAFDEFDVYGHLDYVVRYGPNKNHFFSYKKFKEIIDEILKTLIQKGKGIEINTGGFKYGLGHPNPAEDILKSYHELGGEIITIGSDAHAQEHVAYDFYKVPDILKEAGFSYYTVFKNRKPDFNRLP